MGHPLLRGVMTLLLLLGVFSQGWSPAAAQESPSCAPVRFADGGSHRGDCPCCSRPEATCCARPAEPRSPGPLSLPGAHGRVLLGDDLSLLPPHAALAPGVQSRPARLLPGSALPANPLPSSSTAFFLRGGALLI